MAYVDYDAKIKSAKQKVRELEEKKKVQDNRIYVPIGHVIATMFPEVLNCKNETDIRLFVSDRLGLKPQSDMNNVQSQEQEEVY